MIAGATAEGSEVGCAAVEAGTQRAGFASFLLFFLFFFGAFLSFFLGFFFLAPDALLFSC